MPEYGVNQIKSLKGLDSVRLKPSMYIGTTGQQGINQLIYETWDNSLDEYIMGYGNEIDVIIDKDNYITVTDRGRGIPVGEHPELKDENNKPLNTLTAVMTKLHTGGKLFADGTSGYFSSSGVYGIGIKCCTALSDDLIVTVKRDNNIYQQSFSKGQPTTDVINIGKTKETGTTIKFHPDKEIFKETIIPNDKQLQARLHEITALNANLKINYINEIANVNKTFHYENGIIDYIKNELLVDKKTLFDNPLYYKGTYKDNNETMTAEICFIYQDNIEDNQIIKTFANNITTREHGTHLNGFKEGFRNNINTYATKQKLINSPLEIKYLFDNICLIISVHLKECELEGQTKNKLGNTIAKDGMIQILNDFFKSLSKEQKEIINNIIIRANAVKEAEEAARKARINSRKANKITKIALPGKLADCSTNKGYSEIFYCLKGDTKIKLLNGTSIAIKDLINKQDIWCYSCNEQMQMIPTKINKAFKTREVTQTIKLTFEDNSLVECTPEHRFLDRDTLQWVQAKDLVINQSLGSMKFQVPKTVTTKYFDAKNYNLKVTNIEYINYNNPIPVYCLEVDNDFHSFVLDNGIITHNCEGNSASGSAKAARDSSFQAIMPLRGKILNTEKVDFDKAMNSDTAKAFIASIGTGIGKQFDISKCRYDKIIMMCFTGDTEIKLANDVVITFEELVKTNTDSSNIYPVYSVNENNEIVIGEAYNPRITGYVNELLEIILDNNKIIKCTPNHLFMLSNGDYKQAQDLTLQDELRGINAKHILDKYKIKYDTIIPIYDITVKQYHNFALNSGVFVHNCDADVDK